MQPHLHILPLNNITQQIYNNVLHLYNKRELYNTIGFDIQADSGFDLYIYEDITIPANTTVLVPLGISCEAFVEINGKHTAYYIFPRSSIYKTPLILHNSTGIIDAGYRGELKAPLRNLSQEPYTIKQGHRLLQIIMPNMIRPAVKIVETLSDTDRGSDGFGSTGL